MHRAVPLALALLAPLHVAFGGTLTCTPPAVCVSDPDFDLANYDVVEIETGDVTPIPQPDGIGRIEVTRETPGSTGQAGDGFARILIQGYDTSGSTGYGQIAAIV